VSHLRFIVFAEKSVNKERNFLSFALSKFKILKSKSWQLGLTYFPFLSPSFVIFLLRSIECIKMLFQFVLLIIFYFIALNYFQYAQHNFRVFQALHKIKLVYINFINDINNYVTHAVVFIYVTVKNYFSLILSRLLLSLVNSECRVCNRICILRRMYILNFPLLSFFNNM
jgi:hypothetical protein